MEYNNKLQLKHITKTDILSESDIVRAIADFYKIRPNDISIIRGNGKEPIHAQIITKFDMYL